MNAQEDIPRVAPHARERMTERFGFDPPREAWLSAIETICERRAVLLTRNPADGTEVYAVTFGGLLVRAVWRPVPGIIVTVLGEEQSVAHRQRARQALLRARDRRAEQRRGQRGARAPLQEADL